VQSDIFSTTPTGSSSATTITYLYQLVSLKLHRSSYCTFGRGITVQPLFAE